MQSGTKLGHYEISTLLGKGGRGEVWRARDTKLGREVAIKTLREEFAKDAVDTVVAVGRVFDGQARDALFADVLRDASVPN